ncbi:ExeA family protein [Rhodovulum visakhapatnamense]|uniref:Type II secretion system protein A n=1 Tax=Rhodovulum visakhapatnamense TaxID=364297 RepID=A0A4R8F7P2_9RHOB|nr:AAA family ATPase [Rhodovulum visakhapatnamense]TDX21580.1 type II secretion system protein A [Rhodovulum visakhapatnamense]
MSGSLYNAHFGFRERPFALPPDPDFLFWSKAHSRAFTVLEFGIVSRAPLTVVTGEVGTGKTTLILALLRQLDEDLTIGLISNAQGGRGDLLRWILYAFDISVPTGADYVSMFQQFQSFVLEEYAAGRYVILIVDEAQNLGAETLEELRMLTNINSGKDELLQILLVGQPELSTLIRQPELRQFAQRVSAVYHLEPMTLATTRDYIVHRLQHAGGSGEEFTPTAIRHIHEEAEGIPRMVNKLCDLALVYASSAGTRQVGEDTIKELIQDGLILKPFRDPLLLSGAIKPFGKAAE